MPAAELSPQNLVPHHPNTPEYNLITEPWIPVVTLTGEYKNVGVEEIFTRGHNFKDINTNNLLEYVAILRYLTALAYLAAGLYGKNKNWDDTVESGAPFPVETLTPLFHRIGDYSWLYHPDTPFMQNNCTYTYLSVKVSGKNPTMQDVTHSIYTCSPSSPQARTQTWFTGSRGEYPKTVDKATAARFLLTRHFCALAGNEQDFKLPTMDKPSRRSAGTVILPSYAQATYFLRQSSTLTGTLVANLHRNVLDTITENSVLFWENPLNPTAHLDDSLYLYTATGASTYLPYQGNAIKQVIRTGLPIADKDTVALLTGIARINDPHVIRFTKENTPAQKTGDVVTAYFNPAATTYQQIWETYNRVFSSQKKNSALSEREHLLKPKNAGPLYGKNSAVTFMAISMNTKVGASTGPKIQEVAGGTITPKLFLADPDKRRSLIMLLSNIAGASHSISSHVAYATKNAYGAHKSDRAPVESLLWAKIAPLINNPCDRILDMSETEQADVSLTDTEKKQWITAGVETYMALTKPLLNNPRTTAKVLEQKNALHYNLRRLMLND